ncbi:hypothetical protein [Rhizobium sp. L9]|nr:hypothetical protein [Rhizobium sp. L9]
MLHDLQIARENFLYPFDGVFDKVQARRRQYPAARPKRVNGP